MWLFRIISTKAEITLWLQSAPSWAFLEEGLAFSSVKKRFGEHSPSGFSKHFCKHTNRPFPLKVQPLSWVLLLFQLSALHSGDEFLNSSLGAAQGVVLNQRFRYSQERNLQQLVCNMKTVINNEQHVYRCMEDIFGHNSK